MRGASGFAPPDATPVENIRHGSLQLDDMCPPACPRYMGPARATGSERSPDSELKESGKRKPLGVSGASPTVSWGGRLSFVSMVAEVVLAHS